MNAPSGERRPRRTLARALRDVVTKKHPPLRDRLVKLVGFALPVLTMPITVWFLFENRNIHKGYGLTWFRLFKLT